MSNFIEKLVDMGFSRQRAELAVSKTNTNSFEDVMEWLLTQPEEEPEPNLVPEPAATSSDDISESMENDKINDASETLVARSIKCDECQKLFKNNTEVEFHAAKTGHEKFSESTEEKKPLTEEEKKEQLAKIEAKLKQRRLEREAKERQDALEREKNRIRSGKEMLEAKKKHEDLEIKKMLELKKREKEEEKMARQRVRDQIEQDKLMRKAKFGNQQTPLPAAPILTPPTAAPVTPVASSDSKNCSEVKLQIRLTNGAALTQTFGAKEPLSVVKCYIELNRTDETGPFSLMTSFPRKVFGEEDYDKPLYLLGLAPTAVLFVTKSAGL